MTGHDTTDKTSSKNMGNMNAAFHFNKDVSVCIASEYTHYLILDPFVKIGLAIVSKKVSIGTSGWNDN